MPLKDEFVHGFRCASTRGYSPWPRGRSAWRTAAWSLGNSGNLVRNRVVNINPVRQSFCQVLRVPLRR